MKYLVSCIVLRSPLAKGVGVAALGAASLLAAPIQANAAGVLEGLTLTFDAVETDPVDAGNQPDFFVGATDLGNPGTTTTLTGADTFVDATSRNLQFVVQGDTLEFLEESSFGDGTPITFDVHISGLPTNLSVSDDFVPFTFTGGDLQFSAGGANTADTFTFAATTGGVPEPASWALMILGFGGVGHSLRRRRSLALPA